MIADYYSYYRTINDVWIKIIIWTRAGKSSVVSCLWIIVVNRFFNVLSMGGRRTCYAGIRQVTRIAVVKAPVVHTCRKKLLLH